MDSIAVAFCRGKGVSKRCLVSAFVIFIVMTAGCGIARHQTAKDNLAGLDRLSAGMTTQEVMAIMGPGTEGVAGVKNPTRRELFKIRSGSQIELWYYLTNQFGVEDTEKITPVIFEDDALVGIGWRMLEETSHKYDITIRHR